MRKRRVAGQTIEPHEGHRSPDSFGRTKKNQTPEELPSQRLLSFIKENFPAVKISGKDVDGLLKKMTDGKHVIVSLVGYCPPTRFDENLAKEFVRDGIEEISLRTGKIPLLISGATLVGVLKYGYEMAKERGWPAVGVACERAEEHPLADVGLLLIYGPNWGEESPLFTGLQGKLKQMGQDVYFLKVGGGKQSERERDLVREFGVGIIEKQLPKMETPPA
ncbi:MAG: hypothetical protein NT157_02665 [Candidatus Micrarchaeota archaeon]|nr:hypothetical protein [Candidatus Micrarchaeota archaeon]